MRQRFIGAIAGTGSTSGVRVVVGHWHDTPLGAFSDAMVETAAGHRVLLAPHPAAADLVAATYTFDEVRLEDVEVTRRAVPVELRSPSLVLDLTSGGARRSGVLLRLRARPRSRPARAWCALTDPVARVALRGVRTRGCAGNGRREWYGATDTRAVIAAAGTFDGDDLGTVAPVDPPCRFGFSSTPRRPSMTAVVTTVQG